MDTARIPQPEQRTTTRETGTCAGCGTTTKTLTAPRPNAGHSYKGEMYCVACNPRFGLRGIGRANLARLVAN